MFFLFAMISFVTNLAAPIGTIWGYQFEGNSFLGMLGNMMNFLAYLFMGIPAGKILTRIGYKKTALWAIGIGIVGLLVQWCSGLGDVGTGMFIIYLLGAFICGFCVCMLNTVTNPMLNLLGGGGNRGNQLLQAGGAFNSLAGTVTPFFVGALIGSLTKESHIGNVSPLLWIAIGIFVVAFIVISFVYIPEPNLVKKGAAAPKYSHSPWSFRHTVLGVCAIFMYVGIEVGIPSTLNFYLADQGSNGAGVIGEASIIAGAIVSVYWFLMLVGRTLSSAISGKVSSRAQLVSVSGCAIILIIAAILTPKEVTFNVPSFIYTGDLGEVAQVPMSALFLVLCGLCTSVMWGGIFNLAVEGLGKYTAQASGIFMMMVVGGGVIPLVQQLFAGSVGYMPSYWLLVACLGFIFFYGVAGCINVNKDIDVSYEEELKEELV
ncbi:MAG: MFS transporter [Muribaculaceae bacterium]|nr:MFS transporter [Muribaculaceae bacterium]MDE6009000.1 MFS transporter [Muribaculaceae bacterium]